MRYAFDFFRCFAESKIMLAIETRRELVRLIGQGTTCGGSHFQRYWIPASSLGR